MTTCTTEFQALTLLSVRVYLNVQYSGAVR